MGKKDTLFKKLGNLINWKYKIDIFLCKSATVSWLANIPSPGVVINRTSVLWDVKDSVTPDKSTQQSERVSYQNCW